MSCLPKTAPSQWNQKRTLKKNNETIRKIYLIDNFTISDWTLWFVFGFNIRFNAIHDIFIQ